MKNELWGLHCFSDNDRPKIKTFTDLNAWRKGHDLVLRIYQESKRFPKEEQFGLTSQLRRAAVSVTSNIAEGFSRSYLKEKIQFYAISLGSLTEIQNQLLIARDIGYFDDATYDSLCSGAVMVHKLLNGLIKSSKDRIGHP